MEKFCEKTKKKNTVNAARVLKVAEIVGVSTRYVRYVINGTYKNEEVIRAYMFLSEGENQLLEEAKLLIPFN